MVAVGAPRQPWTSSLTSKGQVTIPIHIRRLLGLTPRDRVSFVVRDGRVEIAPAQSVAERTAGALRRYRRVPAPASEEEREAFERAVAGEVAGSADR